MKAANTCKHIHHQQTILTIITAVFLHVPRIGFESTERGRTPGIAVGASYWTAPYSIAHPCCLSPSVPPAIGLQQSRLAASRYHRRLGAFTGGLEISRRHCHQAYDRYRRSSQSSTVITHLYGKVGLCRSRFPTCPIGRRDGDMQFPSLLLYH